MNKINDWYMVDLWLKENQRPISWLATRLNVSRQIVYIWKDKQQIPEDKKLAICYVTGQTYEQLF
tara:strand:- start:2977 stop:3171 length:195 start_codon:yes stop_codon:yes gene_type:complete